MWPMNNAIQTCIKKTLCPDDIWQLSRVMKSILGYQIGRLPQKQVSDNETRYSETPEGMRAFLEIFFTRHFFQVQNSLIKYLVSEEGLSVLKEGHLRILDIGSGPAVASLAITEIVAYIVRHLVNSSVWRGNRKMKVTYVLNDTESICGSKGRVLILQDRFKALLMRKVAGLIGRQSRKEELTQRTAYTRNDNDMYTYSYYTCLYSPKKDEVTRKKFIA